MLPSSACAHVALDRQGKGSVGTLTELVRPLVVRSLESSCSVSALEIIAMVMAALEWKTQGSDLT